MNEPKARESESSIPGHLTALIRHFIDLRDGTHGGSASRSDKETHFVHAVELLAPVARDRKSTRLNSSHRCISYAGLCLKKKIGIDPSLPEGHLLAGTTPSRTDQPDKAVAEVQLYSHLERKSPISA